MPPHAQVPIRRSPKETTSSNVRPLELLTLAVPVCGSLIRDPARKRRIAWRQGRRHQTEQHESWQTFLLNVCAANFSARVRPPATTPNAHPERHHGAATIPQGCARPAVGKSPQSTLPNIHQSAETRCDDAPTTSKPTLRRQTAREGGLNFLYC